MTFRSSAAFLPVFLLIGLASSAWGQQVSSSCGAPPAIFQTSLPNIFSEEQEQWLGEAMSDHTDSEYRPIKDARLNAYLGTIGARLLAVLPPTKIQFHFAVVESSEINGFSLAGGRVYLTRKLVSSARDEDEIAGVIAHEMGHILTHQFAIETTADMKRLLDVTSVSDRADVYAKYQRLVDARLHQKHQTDTDTDDKQDQADRVAVYASAAAGYRPQAYAEFWDRSFFVGGKTGNKLSDFFGSTKPPEKRLKKIRVLIAELPHRCGAGAGVAMGAGMGSSAEFRKWQQQVLEDQSSVAATPAAAGNDVAAPEEAKTSDELQLSPPLRLDIDRLRFSRDGKYVLAQDESSIFVLSREPFKSMFRIEAERALPADFTPDSTEVAFATAGLHVEKWNIAQQKLVVAHEVVAERNCLQTLLAPDARTIACVAQQDDGELSFLLLDVDTSQVIFEKKSWFVPNFNFALSAFLRKMMNDTNDVLTTSFSADGNILLFGPGSDRLAFDLRTRTQIKIQGPLKSYDYPNSYCFLGSDRIVAVNLMSPLNSGVFSFPDGKRLQQLKLDFPYMHSTTAGDLVITTEPKDNGVALADTIAGKYLIFSKSPAVDMQGGSFVDENPDGSIGLVKLRADAKDVRGRALLPLSPLAPASSVSLSPDGQYLALSERTRGTIWDMKTGKATILMRGFRNGWWRQDDLFVGEFPKHNEKARTISEIFPKTGKAMDFVYKLDDEAHLQDGHLFEWKSQKKTWTFTVSSPFDAAVQWTRNFDDGRPGYTTNFANSDLIFSYQLQSPLGKEKLRNDAALRELANAVKEKPAGRIIEIVNAADGTVRSQVVVEVPRTYDGVDGFSVVGDQLYLSTGDNRTIVYSLKTGVQVRQFFGTLVAADEKSEAVSAVNRRGEIMVMDKSGAEMQHHSLDSPVRFATLRENGGELLVVTANQKVRRFKSAAH